MKQDSLTEALYSFFDKIDIKAIIKNEIDPQLYDKIYFVNILGPEDQIRAIISATTSHEGITKIAAAMNHENENDASVEDVFGELLNMLGGIFLPFLRKLDYNEYYFIDIPTLASSDDLAILTSHSRQFQISLKENSQCRFNLIATEFL